MATPIDVGPESMETKPQQQPNSDNRRADIDVIRILLTWGILLFHTVLIYTPTGYYIHDPFTEYTGWQAALGFIFYMEAWNMPTFFFLSGISVFFALKRRDEKQFRLERFHRLLIPALVIMAVTQFPIALTYFANMSVPCFYYQIGVNPNRTFCFDWVVPGINQSFGDFVRQNWGEPPGAPNTHQGWFLVYLFVYSQILASLFYLWHPASANVDRTCGCCCGGSHRRFLCFFGRRAPTPEAFADAVWWFLGSGVKLALVPGVVIAVVEISLRQFFPNGRFHFFSFGQDVCNDLNFAFVYLLGFAIASVDDRLSPILKRFSWIYFVIGNVLCVANAAILTFVIEASSEKRGIGLPQVVYDTVIRGTLRGFGEWILILGIVGVCRRHITTYRDILTTLCKIAMPFYVTHQQILVAIAVGTLRVAVLKEFPFLLLFSTLATGAVSFAITKSGSFGYFFGLKTPNGSWLPGEKWFGLIPGIVLSLVLVAEVTIASVFKLN